MHDLQGTYMLKLKRNTGEMLTGGEPTAISTDFARQLIAYGGELGNKTLDIGENAAGSAMETVLPKVKAGKIKFTEYSP